MIVSVHVHCGQHASGDHCAGQLVQIETAGHSEQDEGRVLAIVQHEVLKVMAAWRLMHTYPDPTFPEAQDGEAGPGHDGHEAG